MVVESFVDVGVEVGKDVCDWVFFGFIWFVEFFWFVEVFWFDEIVCWWMCLCKFLIIIIVLFIIVLIVIVMLFKDMMLVLSFCSFIMINVVRILIGKLISVIIDECKWNKKIVYIKLIISNFFINLLERVLMDLLIRVEWL